MAGPSLEGLINPRMLEWAREQCRMDIATVASRLKKKESHLLDWESGQSVPTLSQLRKLASLYKRSVGVFFLNNEPSSGPRPVDYRRFELSEQHVMSTELVNTIRDAEAKRLAALDIYVQADDQPPAFDAWISGDMPAESAALMLSDRLSVGMQTRRGWSDEFQALSAWKVRVEALGVLVMQSSGVLLSETRGCSLALFPLPVIILNASDSPLGRIFTLLHELTHLARSESGLCDEIEEAPRDASSQSVEVYCNRVAGAVLVPTADLLGQPDVATSNGAVAWSSDQLRGLRRTFWASREVILRRLLILKRATMAHYRYMRDIFQDEYARMSPRPSGPVPISRRVLLSNGQRLTRLVVEAYDASVITGPELSRILGTKLDHLPQINDVLRKREIA